MKGTIASQFVLSVKTLIIRIIKINIAFKNANAVVNYIMSIANKIVRIVQEIINIYLILRKDITILKIKDVMNVIHLIKNVKIILVVIKKDHQYGVEIISIIIEDIIIVVNLKALRH